MYHPDMFEYKFGRKPKDWTLEEVHDLWLRATKRYHKKRDVSRALWKEIVDTFSEGDKETFHLYHEDEEGTINKFRFSWSTSWDGYGCSRDWGLEFSKNPKVARDEKIDFIINNEKAFEYGKRYYENEKIKNTLHAIVGSIMWEMIDHKLREHFKSVEEKPKSIFQINIGDKKYYIHASGDGLLVKNSYTKFEFGNEVVDEVIKLEGSYREIW